MKCIYAQRIGKCLYCNNPKTALELEDGIILIKCTGNITCSYKKLKLSSKV